MNPKNGAVSWLEVVSAAKSIREESIASTETAAVRLCAISNTDMQQEPLFVYCCSGSPWVLS
jgi:hypothetical protein